MNSNSLKTLVLLVIFALPGCGGPDSGPSAQTVTTSKALVPQDQKIADIYNRSCRSCHTVAATGSPLTGDRAAWAPRMDKGMTVLVDNVVNGFGGMPPFGLCMDCDVEQFEALIQFMANQE